MKYQKPQLLWFLALTVFLLSTVVGVEPLRIADDHRHFIDTNGKSVFWTGDTGWLLLKKLTREETESYLENRREKEMNVIQVMVLHNLADTRNAYGIPAVDGTDISKVHTTPGNLPGEGDAYDYWDHLEWVLDLANSKGLYLALVPVWGSNIEQFGVTPEAALAYGRFMGERFKKYPNIVWINGGDIDGSDYPDVWEALAQGILERDQNHIMTFHPRGRLQSSTWFHDRDWLDFNTFQSGHRRYNQDKSPQQYGEDNWRYVVADWAKKPAKPTLDAEPSYEDIPQGLHDVDQPLWTDDDVRRSAYWSVFTGACGHTYGHNSIMQFCRRSEIPGAYGANTPWEDALDAPGAWQMRFLRRLMESRPLDGRVPAQEIIVENPGVRYHQQVATKGHGYAMIYTYMGDPIKVEMGFLDGAQIKASWFNPRNGGIRLIGTIENDGVQTFDPLGDIKEGNDWVLILETL